MFENTTCSQSYFTEASNDLKKKDLNIGLVNIIMFLFCFASGAVKPSEYYDLGLVTDFKYSFELSQVFSGKKDLKELKNLGEFRQFN